MIRKRKESSVKKVAVGAAVAAAAGYVAGVLTAPKSGKATRGDLKNAAQKGADKVEQEIKQLHSQVDELVSQTKDKAAKLNDKARQEADELMAQAKSSKQKVQDLAQNIKPGKGADKELKKAMADANKAIDHLKKYLKK